MPGNSGKASSSVVAALIKDMRDFSNYVESELQKMVNEANQLGQSWKDPQYDQFRSFINDLTDSLKGDLATFGEATDQLQKKLDMYR